MARVDERQLTAQAKAEERLFLNCDASKYALKGLWRDASVAWETMRDQLPGDFLDLNIAICRYRLGGGAELATHALDLAKRLPPQPSGQAVLLAMLSLHRSGQFDSAASIAAVMGKQGKHPWDLPSLPTVVATTFAIEDSSGSEIIEVLRGLLATCEGEEAKRIQELLVAYGARETGVSAKAAHGGPKGWIERLKAWFGRNT
jgi:hypothetical protein